MISETPPNGVGSEAQPDTKEYVLAKEDLSHLVGKSLDEVNTEHIYEVGLTVESKGKKIPGEMDIASSSRIWTQYLASDKVDKTIMSAKSRESKGFAGPMESGPTKELPLHGKTVLIRKEGDKWMTTLKEGETTDEIQQELDKITTQWNHNVDAKLYGTEPRKVGDEWTAEASALGFENTESGTVKVRFVRTEEYEGQHCAVLIADLDLKGKKDKNGFAMHMKGTVETRRSLDHLIDLSTEMIGTVELQASPQPGITITGNGKVKMESTTKIVQPTQ